MAKFCYVKVKMCCCDAQSACVVTYICQHVYWCCFLGLAVMESKASDVSYGLMEILITSSSTFPCFQVLVHITLEISYEQGKLGQLLIFSL